MSCAHQQLGYLRYTRMFVCMNDACSLAFTEEFVFAHPDRWDRKMLARELTREMREQIERCSVEAPLDQTPVELPRAIARYKKP